MFVSEPAATHLKRGPSAHMHSKPRSPPGLCGAPQCPCERSDSSVTHLEEVKTIISVLTREIAAVQRSI